MAIIEEESALTDSILQVAKLMVAAAVTAPKGRGISNLTTAIFTGNDIGPLIAKMEQMAAEFDLPSFHRDAQNLKQCDVVVLMGTSIAPMNLKKCGMCGFANCTEKSKYPQIPCSFNTGDLGIAMGSAVSVAMNHKIDNRIMYSVGQAAIALEIFPKEVLVVYAIPLKASNKNIFFDRN